MLQDRNIHRDAQALRKAISVPLNVPAFGVDQDEPFLVLVPRYNWRLSDLSVSIQSLSTAELIVKAQAVPPTCAAGSPQLGALTSPNFSVEEFWRRENENDNPGLANKPATAALGFGGQGAATVLDGFWGVWLIEVNQSLDTDVFAGAAIMAFATEAIALANCPRVRPSSGAEFNGRAAILTVQAVGADWIAGTDNTDAAQVAAFNTAPQDGHVIDPVNISTGPQSGAALLGQQLKDASGTNILQGKGNGSGAINDNTGAAGDLLVLTVRSSGAPVLVGGVATVEYRPWPAGGEGLGDASVSQNRPSFVP